MSGARPLAGQGCLSSVAHLRRNAPGPSSGYSAPMNASHPAQLPFTGDPEADSLLASNPTALLIGFVLDQQVSVQKAFAGPLELQRRIGTLDATVIAGMDPGDLEEAFRARPALHRFPGNMAKRTQAFCATLAAEYEGRAERVWTEASDGSDLERRLLALPGIGEMKAKSLLAILSRRFRPGASGPGTAPAGLSHPRRCGLSRRPGPIPGAEARLQAAAQGRGQCVRSKGRERVHVEVGPCPRMAGMGLPMSRGEVYVGSGGTRITWSLSAAGRSGRVRASRPQGGRGRCCRQRMDPWA